MKHWLWIVYFAVVHAPNGDYPATYQGMSQETIRRLETERGNTVEFVTQKAYDEFIESHKLPAPIPDPVREAARETARETLKSALASTDQKVTALILILDLDR